MVQGVDGRPDAAAPVVGGAYSHAFFVEIC